MFMRSLKFENRRGLSSPRTDTSKHEVNQPYIQADFDKC